MHILLHIYTVYKDLEDILAIQELHLKEKKPFYKILKLFVLYSQLPENTEN